MRSSNISEEQAQNLVESKQDTFPDNDDMAWRDQPDRSWSGYDVEIEETDVYDPDAVMGAPSTEGLRVIKLEGLEGAPKKPDSATPTAGVG